ncbi:extracellular solute-binding protein [Streptomyces sp. NPDC047097]|uniref:extracellular solute-binding protein n=1 Tax=Streptomyces sp. NPDC047097 TaxID=3155260 RepID=UPI0033DDD3C5
MQRRYYGTLAAVAALSLAATLSGCGAGTGSGEVTLKLVAADYGSNASNTSQKYWDELVAAFRKKHPDIAVEVDVRSWKDVDRDVAEMVAKDEAPDLAQIGAYADFAAEGKLYPTSELLPIPTQANFLQRLNQAGEVDRVQYGMPFAASTRLLFFNEELFEKAGLEPPKTWQGIVTAAAKLKAQGVKYPFALPLGTEESQAETMMWMLSGGGGYQDAVNTGYDINSAANIQTFTWLKDKLVTPGLTGPIDPGQLDRQAAFDAFTKGEVGMLNGHPTLMEAAEKAGVKFGMVPLPSPDGEATPSMGVADWMMAFKQNGHREEIGEFLKFVYEDQNVLDFSDAYDILPVTVTASTAMEGDAKHKKLRPFLRELDNSELYPVGKTSWARVSKSVKANIGKAVTPDGDPEAVLNGIAKEAADAEAAE